MSKKLKWEPEQWKEQLENIRLMRKDRNAPVDVMGCESLSLSSICPKERRLTTLVSLMLSSQTKDEITANAMVRLKEQIKPFDVEGIISTNDEDFGKLIYPVGFWKTKTKHIKKAAEILKEKYDGDIPNTIETLCELPGVGPKMAYIAMSVAWNQVVGIGVDTHVHRIANRLGWTRKATKLPDNTRKELEDWLPNSYWEDVNKLLVGFGQQICKPVKPNCLECLNNKICPFGLKNEAKTKNKKSKPKSKKKITTS